jgi:hypothetical protein
MTNVPDRPDRSDEDARSDPPEIPPELMRKLHDANEHFHEAREELDDLLDADERAPGEGKKVRHTLHAAEEELEQVTHEVNEVLKIPDPLPADAPPEDASPADPS